MGGRRMTDLIYRIKTDGRLFDPLVQLVTDKEHAKLHVEHVLGPVRQERVDALMARQSG